MYEKRVARACSRALWAALAVYAALLAPSIRVGRPMQDGDLRTAGFPRLSMFGVWIVMGASCAIITFARCSLGR
jgi:hypothetical protein